MADTLGDQATLVQDESFELVDHSDTLSDQIPSLFDIVVEAPKLEKRSEEDTEEVKVCHEFSVLLIYF